ncbi:HAD-IIA family hydrolase [Halorubrum sp. CBA1125]|uniref:HAD-IIA family hydrolase n=1 Tax=Halorubrum sp. CBA1125 TaxID=2668072 RepID=UPI0012E773FF|nr:HAD-IIA family hydrolase [Halorubrum sp. CBA1125]MUW14544.1 HAD-IIA family hydrolase [Halorubrum sp. CBA1125]
MLADRFDGLLFDLDGVVYLGDQPVTNTVKVIERLQQEGITVRFITNSSSSTRRDIRSKLAKMGIDVEVDDVFSAAWATATYASEAGHNRAYVLGTPGLEQAVQNQGLQVVETDPDVLIVGNDKSLTYEKLTDATRTLYRNDIPFLAVNSDPVYPTADGISPGTGALVSALKTATNQEPIVIGKPHENLFDFALEGLEDQRVAIVGDTPESDVAGAQRAGIEAILFTKHQRNRSDESPSADIEISDTAELLETDS